jgi:hypothetical protein
MTPEKIIESGINRTSLWHFKKNLSDDKIPKIYE